MLVRLPNMVVRKTLIDNYFNEYEVVGKNFIK